jgi:DNA-binding response OmpR family regulator
MDSPRRLFYFLIANKYITKPVNLLELYFRVNTSKLLNQNKFINTDTTDRDILHRDVRDFDLS